MNPIVRNVCCVFATVAGLTASNTATAQERRARIDVEHYVIDAQIDPLSQSVNATVQVRFTPTDNLTAASFELNNALNVSRIADASGRQIPASRSQADYAVRLSFPDGLNKGQQATLTFNYDGKLTGQEESPVF